MNEAESKLVEALRSGKYQQGRQVLRNSFLHTSDKFYCCLGVACEISGLGHWEIRSIGDSFVEETDSRTSLTLNVRKWLHWSHEGGLVIHPVTRDVLMSADGGPITLMRLNDSEFTFPQIADIIQANMIEHGEEPSSF